MLGRIGLPAWATKEAPAIPTQVVGASSIFALRRPGAETHIHRARAAHSAQLVRRPFAGRPLTDRFLQTSELVHPSKPAENSTSRPAIGGQAAHERRGAADRGQRDLSREASRSIQTVRANGVREASLRASSHRPELQVRAVRRQ